MMKRVVCVFCALLALAIAGCNPVGMDDTRLYVTGFIYVDGGHTMPAEGVGVTVAGTDETYQVLTGADGRFWIEVQLYPENSEETGTGGTPGSATFSTTAYWANSYYAYGGDDYIFTVFGGDTLTLWSVCLADFKVES